IFNGNGYSDAWVEEAEKRGLPNIKSMVDAASALTTEKSVALFEKFKIFTKVELESREEITYETYSKTINIEALTMIDMAKKLYLPAIISYTKELADTVKVLKEVGADTTVQCDVLSAVSAELAKANAALKTLESATAKAEGIEDAKAQAYAFKDDVKTAMDALRKPVDTLENLVDKNVWPVPSYADLIFEV
ncbi:MAG: glutamine synthetase type III, partial [Lachnospiraceae bacterium]|nr:glutamine synthetase type III [Lachnospiraceae bacterium]